MLFAGKFCEIDVDDCEGNACQNEARCVDGLANYECLCPPRFKWVHLYVELKFIHVYRMPKEYKVSAWKEGDDLFCTCLHVYRIVHTRPSCKGRGCSRERSRRKVSLLYVGQKEKKRKRDRRSERGRKKGKKEEKGKGKEREKKRERKRERERIREEKRERKNKRGKEREKE